MFPYKIEPVEESINKELLAHFEGERTGFCQVGPEKWLLPASYADHAEKYYTMPLREDDVWIVTYPRTGTTVCQELIWMVNTNFDYETAQKVPLLERFPFYEFPILHHEDFHKDVIALNNNDPEVIKELELLRKPGYETVHEMASPRHIKTHFPFSLLPPKLTETCKVIYVARNPKDVAVSYYHHNRLIQVHGYNGDFKKYWEFFQNDLLTYSPFWNHVKEGWDRRNDHNVLFLFYEDLVRDMASEIKKVAVFLNKSVTDDQVNGLVQHLQIDNFRKAVSLLPREIPGMMKSTEQQFIRQGKVGGNKEYTDDMIDQVNEWIEENSKKFGVKFPVKAK